MGINQSVKSLGDTWVYQSKSQLGQAGNGRRSAKFFRGINSIWVEQAMVEKAGETGNSKWQTKKELRLRQIYFKNNQEWKTIKSDLLVAGAEG